jgi:hypothetical protein
VSRARYRDDLRKVPAFRDCTPHQLTRIARLVDTIALPAGAAIGASDREIVLTLVPTTVLVVERRAWAMLIELAPAIRASPRLASTCSWSARGLHA